jgi:hypothetical protein
MVDKSEIPARRSFVLLQGLRRFILVLAGLACVLGAVTATAQTPRAAQTATTPGMDGRWEGRLGAGGLRLVLELSRTADGLFFGTMTSVDQGGTRLPIDQINVTGDSIRFEIRSVRGTYAGELSSGRTELVGTFTQRGQARLDFTRVSAPPTPEPKLDFDSPFGIAAELAVPVRPVLFPGAGKKHLAYEIHVTNYSGAEMLVTRFEVLGDSTVLARWEGAELHAIMAQRRANVTDNRAIPAGGWAIVYAWATIDSAALPPAMLRHRLWVGGRSLEGETPVSIASQIRIGPPLRGGDWVARNGPANTGGHHRRALLPIGGRTFLAQRFATDWVRVAPDDRVFAGDPAANASYLGYGAEVLAVADGVVESVKDGIAENVPGTAQRAVPMTLETIGGNYVILDIGQGRYAFYAHLMPHSLRVKRGDRVRRGQVIGRLGNSGNSTGPHLHFHVSDRGQPLEAEGLPYVIDAWERMRAPGSWERRTNEIPMQNERVRFPQD